MSGLDYPMIAQVIVEADGGSRGNPGPAGSGALLIDADTGRILAEAAIFIGVATNNVAEYRAVIAGLELAKELAPGASVLVRMDSKLVVEQMSGRWKIRHQAMAELSSELHKQLEGVDISFEWVPREQNLRADALANEAMDAEESDVRKFMAEPGTSSINIVSSSSKSRVVDIEYNPLLPSSVRAPRDITKKLTTIVLLRHGRTAFTESHRISGRGGEDPSLSEAGLLDAIKAADEIAKIGSIGLLAKVSAPVAVISSPLNRTKETAEIVARKLGLEVAILEDLAEISFGDWDGHTSEDVAKNWPEDFERWRGDINMAPPGGGESIKEFDRRIQKAKKHLLDNYEGQTIAVVSHVMPIRGFLRAALEADWSAYWRVSLSPCSITVLRFWGDEAAEVSYVNYSGHL